MHAYIRGTTFLIRVLYYSSSALARCSWRASELTSCKAARSHASAGTSTSAKTEAETLIPGTTLLLMMTRTAKTTERAGTGSSEWRGGQSSMLWDAAALRGHQQWWSLNDGHGQTRLYLAVIGWRAATSFLALTPTPALTQHQRIHGPPIQAGPEFRPPRRRTTLPMPARTY